MSDWHRLDANHHIARFDSGRYDVVRIDGRWTLWFQARLTRGFIRKPGDWARLADAKRRAKVLDNDHFLEPR